MQPREIDYLLRREDKWYLGGGRHLIWAPAFPLYLDKPGFWDHAQYLDLYVSRLFTLSLVDSGGTSLPLQAAGRNWQPSHLRQSYTTANGLILSEERVLLENDVLAAAYTLTNQGNQPVTVNLMAWSYRLSNERDVQVQRVDRVAEYFLVEEAYRRNMNQLAQPDFRLGLAFGWNLPVDSFSAQLSETNSDQPRWEFTPFWEEFIARGHLQNHLSITGYTPYGAHYLGLHHRLQLSPGESRDFTIAVAVAPTPGAAGETLAQLMSCSAPPASENLATGGENRGSFVTTRSQTTWERFFSSVPAFSCSDPFLERYYWYRWYGLHLNMLQAPTLMAPYPAVFEGISYFRRLISYSAQCHMRECRWMHDPAVAQGSLLNFLHNQAPDGLLPARIQADSANQDFIYHADWGDCVLEVQRVHPDNDFLRRAYTGLSRYHTYFRQFRDRENLHLYDVLNHWETGQEFMSRYQQVNPQAEHGGSIQLKGVDATVYTYRLEQTLAYLARKVMGRNAEADSYAHHAALTGKAILERMWDPERRLFFDVDPQSGARITAAAAVGFYPFFTDLVGMEHLSAIHEHLLDPQRFWTPFPVPSSSAADTLFCDEPEWQGKRHNCPWNGRTWPMTNSHTAEALAGAARLDHTLRPVAADFISRFVRMLFLQQQLAYPTSYEHYNPTTGVPCLYRGIEDYQHSWVVDLLIKYVAGLQPQNGNQITIDPFPFNLSYFRLERVYVKGHWLDIAWQEGDGLRIWVDGAISVHRPTLQRVELELP